VDVPGVWQRTLSNCPFRCLRAAGR
jgi:hypothetical protein